jgi:hypothetical protein
LKGNGWVSHIQPFVGSEGKLGQDVWLNPRVSGGRG